MKKIPISILCGIVSVLVTIILYFTIIENMFLELICLATLFGVVLAEIVVTVMAYFTKRDPRKVAATVVASLMIPISIFLSFIYIIGFPDKYVSYFCYYFVAFAIIIMVSAILWKYADNRTHENYIIQNAKENMLNMRKLVQCIKLEPNAKEYMNELNGIEDKLHFSNDSIISEKDSLIYNMLTVLRENINNEAFDTSSHIEKISKEIDTRNILTKRTV